MSKTEKVLAGCLFGFALSLPISIAVSQPLSFLVAPLWIFLAWQGRQTLFGSSPYRWPVLLFLVIVLATSVFGVRPDVSLHKLHRFLTLSVIFALPALAVEKMPANWKSGLLFVTLFLVGSSIKAAYDVVRVPVQLWQGVDLFHTGNMREPQMYLVALALLLAILLLKRWSLRQPWVAVALILNTLGLLLHFKRGAWISFVVAAALIVFASGRRKMLVMLALMVVGVLAVPQVRDRLGMLQHERSEKLGGRYALWTDVAPELIREYPWGMGWKATKHEDFMAYSDFIQPKLNHLHNNLLQVTLELGWAGLAAWLYWMGTTVVILFRSYRRCAATDAERAAVVLGAAGGFCGLLINGMVEYNFGDSEIFMLMIFLMALSSLVWSQLHGSQGDTVPRQAGG